MRTMDGGEDQQILGQGPWTGSLNEFFGWVPW